jgi:hypothetical protein
MGINSQEVSFGFGQMGSAYLADTSKLATPTGKIIVAITILTDITKFAELVPDTSGYLDGSTGANIQGATAYIGTTTPVAANGTNADAINTATTWKAGITIYGRWTSVDLGAGAVIVYYSDL